MQFEKLLVTMDPKGCYSFRRQESRALEFYSDIISITGIYNFSGGKLRVNKDESGHFILTYKVSYFRWMFGMLFISFLFMGGILVFLFFSGVGSEEYSPHQYVAVSFLFWGVLWPFLMTLIYGFILKRLFRKLMAQCDRLNILA